MAAVKSAGSRASRGASAGKAASKGKASKGTASKGKASKGKASKGTASKGKASKTGSKSITQTIANKKGTKVGSNPAKGGSVLNKQNKAASSLTGKNAEDQSASENLKTNTQPSNQTGTGNNAQQQDGFGFEKKTQAAAQGVYKSGQLLNKTGAVTNKSVQQALDSKLGAKAAVDALTGNWSGTVKNVADGAGKLAKSDVGQNFAAKTAGNAAAKFGAKAIAKSIPFVGTAVNGVSLGANLYNAYNAKTPAERNMSLMQAGGNAVGMLPGFGWVSPAVDIGTAGYTLAN